MNGKPLFLNSLTNNSSSRKIKLIKNSFNNIIGSHSSKNMDNISMNKNLYKSRRKTINPILKSKNQYLNNYLRKKVESNDTCSFLGPKISHSKS